MAYSKVEQIAFELAEPIAKANGCSIYDVAYTKEGGAWFLRIYADKEGGITLDDCEVISRALSQELDRADPIAQNYYLEVSSPGVERRLTRPEHFQQYIGSQVTIHLYQALNGAKQIVAELLAYKPEGILVRVDGAEVLLPHASVSKVNLYFSF